MDQETIILGNLTQTQYLPVFSGAENAEINNPLDDIQVDRTGSPLPRRRKWCSLQGLSCVQKTGVVSFLTIIFTLVIIVPAVDLWFKIWGKSDSK